jgi:hypothetical protein
MLEDETVLLQDFYGLHQARQASEIVLRWCDRRHGRDLVLSRFGTWDQCEWGCKRYVPAGAIQIHEVVSVLLMVANNEVWGHGSHAKVRTRCRVQRASLAHFLLHRSPL